jgi:hypothetical protein
MNVFRVQLIEIAGLREAALENRVETRLDQLSFSCSQDARGGEAIAVSDAGAHVGFEELAIETKAAIKLSKAGVGCASEPPTPKISVLIFTHHSSEAFRLDFRIVPQLSAGGNQLLFGFGT